MIVGIRIGYRSGPVNLYHCCVPKTGSQWIGKILSDPIFYRYSGLEGYHYQTSLPGGDGSRTDPNALVIRFEDLTGSTSVEVFEALFRHCDIHVPQKILRRLLTKYSFEALAGRKRGEERKEEHYRKGISGDWKNYLSDALARRFEELAGNVVSRLEHRVWILPILFQPIMVDLG